MNTEYSIAIGILIDNIKNGKLLLPELQRRYVWRPQQVRDFFDSLYRGYPSGQLLVWETDDLPNLDESRELSVSGVQSVQHGAQLLLDGQQRLTSLAAVMLGLPLKARFKRNVQRPIDILFNVNTERFEVAGRRLRGETGWVSLSELFKKGSLEVFMSLNLPASVERQAIGQRLQRLENIRQYTYRVNVLTNANYDEVTNIFVRINSGGTKLSNADLALAQLSSRWRGVTDVLSAYREKHLEPFGLDAGADNGLLLRCLSIILSGQTRLAQFFRGSRKQITVVELEAAWKRVERGMNQAVQFLITNCKINRFDLLTSKNILIPLVAFFDKFGTNVAPEQIRDLQRWVYLALIWSRYGGAAESRVDQDVAALNSPAGVTQMIQNIEDQVGQRPVTERDLEGQRSDSAFTLMLYVLAQQNGAQDWFNGVQIGPNQKLELHHVFPRAVLKPTYNLSSFQNRLVVDQIANLAFLSGGANRKIGNKRPADYLTGVDTHRLHAQYVPTDTSLYTVDRFPEFVRERRRLLAHAINELLDALAGGNSFYLAGPLKLLEGRIDHVEHQVRDLVTRRLTDSMGEAAWDNLVPRDIRNSIDARIRQRVQQRPFEADLFDEVREKLHLAQFSDYAKIMKTNWSMFQDAFGDGNMFDRHIQAVTTARNAVKHNNALDSSSQLLAQAGLQWIESCLDAVALEEAEEAEDTLVDEDEMEEVPS